MQSARWSARSVARRRAASSGASSVSGANSTVRSPRRRKKLSEKRPCASVVRTTNAATGAPTARTVTAMRRPPGAAAAATSARTVAAASARRRAAPAVPHSSRGCATAVGAARDEEVRQAPMAARAPGNGGRRRGPAARAPREVEAREHRAGARCRLDGLDGDAPQTARRRRCAHTLAAGAARRDHVGVEAPAVQVVFHRPRPPAPPRRPCRTRAIPSRRWATGR